MSKKIYPSKLLLFGEYTVIYGSQALALPLYQYSGEWKMGESAYDFTNLLNYLTALKKTGVLADLDVNQFGKDIKNGLSFETNIPIGYGLGSSGAVCAAIYDRYAKKDSILESKDLKLALAQMENFFHGASSGMDPLVCYTQKAILSESGKIKIVEDVPFSTTELTVFLIDTQKSRSTEPFVKIFKERCEDMYYRGRVEAELVPLTENAIHLFLKQESNNFFNNLHELSYFQYRFFEPMILDDFKDIWLAGLSGDLYKLKLCGAGGGGMILGFTKYWEKTKEALGSYKMIKIE